MKTTLFLPLLIAAALCISCSYTDFYSPDNGNGKKGLSNNTLNNDALKGKIKQMTTFKTKKNTPKGVEEFDATLNHYDEDGFITEIEKYHVINEKPQPLSFQTFKYSNGELESIETQAPTGNKTSHISLLNIDGQQINTYKGEDGKMTMKTVHTFNPTFSYKTTKMILFNSKQEPDVIMHMKYEYSDDGLLKRIITSPEVNGVIAGIEYSGVTTYEVLKKDSVGNPTVYIHKTYIPTGESSIDTLTRAYQYY